MRKQWIALLLCLCLCAAPLCSLADVVVREPTQLDKLRGQWASSSFQGTLTGQQSGAAPAFLGEMLWAQIGAYLKNFSVTFTHTNQDATSALGSEDVLTLSDASGDIRIDTIMDIDHNGIRYVRSPLLDDQTIYYAFDQKFDAVALLTDAAREDAWPSLLHVLYAVATADEDWQSRAKSSYSQFTLQITTWLQNYATTVTQQNTDGRYVVSNDYEIPAAALLQEAKQLMLNLYDDQEMISLLREILTVDEQAAYLQKSMLLGFLTMIDRVRLNGDIVIRRQFGADSGEVLYESVYLPFADSFPLREATLIHSAEQDGPLWQLRAVIGKAPYEGAIAELTAQEVEAGIWAGELIWTGAPDPQTGLTPDPLTFAYNLEWPGPEDVNDTYARRYERNQKATLVVKPDESLGLPVMSLTWNSQIYSKTSSESAATYLTSTLEWVDLESQASITLSFSGNTRARRTPVYLQEAIASSLRLDMLNTEDRTALLRSLMHNLPARFLMLISGTVK